MLEMSGVFPFSHWKCKLIFNGLETLWNKHLYYPFEFSASGLLWIKRNKSNTFWRVCLSPCQACIDENAEMVQFLVENGSDVNRGDNEGWTPLHAAASCGFIQITKWVVLLVIILATADSVFCFRSTFCQYVNYRLIY